MLIQTPRLVRAVYATRKKIIYKNHVNRGFWLRRRPKASGGVYIRDNTSEPPDTISLLAGGAVFLGMLALRTQRVGVLRARVCEIGVAKNQNTPKTHPKCPSNPVPPLRLSPQVYNAHRAEPGVCASAPWAADLGPMEQKLRSCPSPGWTNCYTALVPVPPRAQNTQVWPAGTL